MRAPELALRSNGNTERLNPLYGKEWESLLSSQPGRSVFHSAAWAKVLNESYGFAPQYFVASGTAKGCSLLPMMEINSWLTGRRGVSLPFTDECKALVPDVGSFQRLFDAALNYGRARGWRYVELRGGKEFLPDACSSQTFHGHEINLDVDEESLFNGLRGSVRQAIRKAQRLGLTVEFSRNLDAVRTFYGLHCQTRRTHGLPPQPFGFFRRLCRYVLEPDNGLVVIVRQGVRAVASSIFVQEHQNVVYKYGASDRRWLECRGNNLAMWAAMQHYARKGCKILDLGRTSTGDEGLRRFKRSWGTRERLIEYIRFDLTTNKFVTCRDETFGWHNRVFRFLPLFLSRMTGVLLYRHVG
jgi:hypothetical protein